MVEVYVSGWGFTKSGFFERNLSAMNRSLKIAVALSLSWNVFLVLGVITNQSFAFSRAAGGQFDSFPIGIRIAYILNLAVVIYQAVILFSSKKRSVLIVKSIFVLSILSVSVNALSRSTAERWNAIPAALIAYAFYREVKAKKA
jgi:hypothetical protein